MSITAENLSARTESNWVLGRKLQERVEQLFRIQKTLLRTDFDTFLTDYISLDTNIENAGAILKPGFLALEQSRVPLEAIDTVEELTSEIIKNEGIELEYLSLVEKVNPKRARDLLLEGEEMVWRVQNYRFESEDDYLNFWAGESSTYKRDLIQACLQGALETFPSHIYEELEIRVSTLRELAARREQGEPNKKVPGEWVWRRVKQIVDMNSIFNVAGIYKYISKKLKQQGLKRGEQALRKHNLVGTSVLSETLYAINELYFNVTANGGINLSDADLGSRVFSERIMEEMEKTLAIIKDKYHRVPWHDFATDSFFAEVLSMDFSTLNKYRKSAKLGEGWILKRAFEYRTRLESEPIDERKLEKTFSDEYFAVFDQNGTILNEKPRKKRKKKAGRKKRAGVKVKRRLHEMYELQTVFPYSSFIKYVREKLSREHSIETTINKLQDNYLSNKTRDNKPLMHALGKIGRELRENEGQVNEQEIRYGNRIYNANISEVINEAVQVIEQKYRKRVKNTHSMHHFFAEMTGVSWHVIRRYHLQTGEKFHGDVEIYFTLKEYLEDLQLSITQRKKRVLEFEFPEQYFCDLDAKGRIIEEQKEKAGLDIIDQMHKVHGLQEMFPYNYFREFVRTKIDKDYSTKVSNVTLQDCVLKEVTYEKPELMNALRKLETDIREHGIKREEIKYGKKVYSKKVRGLIKEALRIIERRFEMRVKSEGSRNKFFAQVAGVTDVPIRRYFQTLEEGGYEFAPSQTYIKINDYIEELRTAIAEEISIEFPEKFFVKIETDTIDERVNGGFEHRPIINANVITTLSQSKPIEISTERKYQKESEREELYSRLTEIVEKTKQYTLNIGRANPRSDYMLLAFIGTNTGISPGLIQEYMGGHSSILSTHIDAIENFLERLESGNVKVTSAHFKMKGGKKRPKNKQEKKGSGYDMTSTYKVGETFQHSKFGTSKVIWTNGATQLEAETEKGIKKLVMNYRK